MLSSPVLVLNVSFEPISITTVRKAVVLVLKGVATVEEVATQPLRTARRTYPQPSVIKLRDYRSIPRRVNIVSRKNIFIRDRYVCQYCQKKLTGNDLTLDHVIPESRGGRGEWGNLVACCKPCNNRKGSQTLEEAGLTLPARALYGIHTSRHLVRQAGEDNELWRPYLFY